MIKYGQLMRGVVSTFSLIYAHLQTIAVFAQLRLPWPMRVRDVLEHLGIAGASRILLLVAALLRLLRFVAV